MEFGQAFWLDKRHGFTPNVTASHTFSSEVFQSACIPLGNVSNRMLQGLRYKSWNTPFHYKIDPSKSKLAHKLAKLEFGTPQVGKEWWDGSMRLKKGMH